MKTENEIISEIRRLQEIDTTMEDGRTDIIEECKRAVAIWSLLFVLGRVDNIDIEGKAVNE